MIVLEPLGGLANRMRVIASGIWLQQKLNTGLVVIWNENNELNCSYHQLFEPSPAFTIIAKPKKYRYVKSTHQVKNIDRWRAIITNKLSGIDNCIQEHDFHQLIWPGKLDIYQAAQKHNRIYIQTCQEFGDNDLDYSHFKPIPAITNRIKHITNSYPNYTIGVQIRRTDNDSSIQYSPIGLFIDAMQNELALHPDITFFLCSDDIETKRVMLNTFGDRIITFERETDRKTVMGMQDAVVDLYCLSKTNKILGSYYSSFAEVAAQLNHTQLHVLKIN